MCITNCCKILKFSLFISKMPIEWQYKYNFAENYPLLSQIVKINDLLDTV